MYVKVEIILPLVTQLYCKASNERPGCVLDFSYELRNNCYYTFLLMGAIATCFCPSTSTSAEANLENILWTGINAEGPPGQNLFLNTLIGLPYRVVRIPHASERVHVVCLDPKGQLMSLKIINFQESQRCFVKL